MAQSASSRPDLGTGVYTYAEAARLLQVKSARVRRWAQGYCARRRGREIRKEPILRSDAARLGVVTFADLVELMFVKCFISLGVPLAEVVAAAERLALELDTPYPFACKRLETDGRQLLEAFGPGYRNPATLQIVFAFASELFKDVDFDPDTCLAERWWPLGRDRKIVVDRHRSFGAPIVEERSIRTDVLYATYKAEERDAELVAEWYRVPKEAVLAAVEFEEEWLKAA